MFGTTLLRFVAISLGLLMGGHAFAATCDDVEFQDSIDVSTGALTLNGLGLRKATFFKVKVYVVGLYLPEKSGDAKQILQDDKPWRLALRFVRGVDASDMKDAFHEGFENTGADLGPLKERIDTLVGMFSDFAEGQTLSFDYDPDKGTAVGLNGSILGTVEGGDFASALLAIWLGAKPANDEMKAGLLGGTCAW